MGLLGESWATWGLAVLGLGATWLASRYYALKGVQKSALGARLLGCHRVVLTHSDFSAQLEVIYDGKPVKELFQSSVIIGNCGNIGLEGRDAPLRISLKDDVDVIGVDIQHVSPSERNVNISHEAGPGGRYEIIVEFDVLRQNEFIILQLLTDGPLRRDNMTFTITSKDLPPKLKHDFLKMDWLVRENQPASLSEVLKRNWQAVALAPLFALASISLYKLGMYLGNYSPESTAMNLLIDASFYIAMLISFTFALFTLGILMYLNDEVPWRRVLKGHKPVFRIPQDIGFILPDDIKRGFQKLMGDASIESDANDS